MRAVIALVLPFVLTAQLVLLKAAEPTTLNFDNLLDSTVLTSQFQGYIFQNATVISKGISLNEFECPPRSGSNVVFDNGGPMTIIFLSPVKTFAGYFTYSMPLTIQAFDSSANQVAATSSQFSSNEAISGVTGSSPNELLQVSFGTGISKLTITGAAGGSSFALDDVALSILNPCDLSGDGGTNITDVQLITNEALGTPQAADDLNGDGVVNVVDVQILINSALRLGCSSP